MMPNNGENDPPLSLGCHRLSARVFYGIIVAGVLLGTLISAAAAWTYLEAGDRQPTARRIWGDVATMFVIPVAVMIGATFGGLVGFATAAILDRKRRHIVPK